jgi:hypothetical protein
MGGNNLVNPMWLATGICQWTVHFIAESRDRASTNIVSWRATDDSSTMIRFVADRDYF